MSATLRFRSCVIYAENASAELVLWRLRVPLIGSTHRFKYRLAFVVDGVCALRFDNEAGKGDHWHEGTRERAYRFTTPDQLLAHFEAAIARWNDENRDA